MKNKDFYHLHIHDQYSLLDGYGTANQYCEYAKELNLPGLALTNHASVDGLLDWQKACDKNGIQPIFGCEAYIVPDVNVKIKKEKRYHINLLCTSIEGFYNIMKMLNEANLEHYYYKPRIDPQILLNNLDGLIVGTACLVSFMNMPEGLDLLVELKKRTTVFIEIMPHMIREQAVFNQTCIKYSNQFNIPIIATNDCHYIKNGQSTLQEVLLAMQTKKTWDNKDRWKFDMNTLWLMTADEMINAFNSQGVVDSKTVLNALSATAEIAQMCNFKIERQKVNLPMPKIKGYEDLNEDEQLVKLVMDGYRKRKSLHDWINDSNESEYLDRMAEELELIISLGFSRYFLIVYELIDWCRKMDIMTSPGRGSVGGSLVAYCLFLHKVDPIKTNLVFSRFISEGRVNLPDIDMDFEDRKRGLVLEHLKKQYGKYNVVGLSTFTQMRGKSALRDVSRVFKVPLPDVDKASDCIVTKIGEDAHESETIKEAFELYEDGIRFKKKYPNVSNIAMGMEGQVRGCGVHAAACCISTNDIRFGIEGHYARRGAKGNTVCNWEKNDAEYMGLMKLDVLGLNSLTVLAGAKELIKERHGIVIDYDTLPYDDPKVYEEFSAGNNVGVFQFGSKGISRLCQEIGVTNLEDLITLNALYRPGTLRSGLVYTYKERKLGQEPVTYLHPIIENITRDTYGVIIYQEQVMRVVHELAGLPWSVADEIRVIIGKSKGTEEFLKYKDRFVQGCKNTGTLGEQEATELYELLQDMGSYSFNRSHSAAYSILAAWQMWLKVYYPSEYMTAILTYGRDERKEELIAEARRLKLKILLPDINLSLSEDWTIDEEGNLLIPLQEIKTIGPVTADEIVKARDGTASKGRVVTNTKKLGPFKDLEDFEKRVDKRKVNVRSRELLKKVMCFDTAECRGDLGEERLEELSQYFHFNLSNDPMYRFRKVLKRIGQWIDVEPISNTIDNTSNSQSRWHFGLVENLRFTKDDTGAVGGAFCDFKDSTGYTPMGFGDCYQSRKYDVEHCDGRWVLASGKASSRGNSFRTEKFYFGEDLLEGSTEGLGTSFAVSPITYSLYFLNEKGMTLDVCTNCELSKECRKPVPPSHGNYNMMLVGEAPGSDEDRLGKPFIGAAGNLLWTGRPGFKGLNTYGLTRDLFHVTNVCKCFPSRTRTPKSIHIRACSQYLHEEIETVKPFIILAMGNTGLKFFKGVDSGITNLSGTTEWNDEFNCWVCYSLHPAAVLHHSENLDYLKIGIETFAKKVAYLF